MLWLVLFLIPTAALAQSEKTIFPSDSQNPKTLANLALLGVVCPGNIVSAEARCTDGCPNFTGFANLPGIAKEDMEWKLRAVTRGHFLSPRSTDAVLWMAGCEPHAENWGGTFLLTLKAGKWVKVWYKAGIQTEECHKVALVSGRQVLVCLAGWGGQGLVLTHLLLIDVENPNLNSEDEPLYQVADNTATCGENGEDASKPEPLLRAYIEKVEFLTRNAEVSSMRVTTQSGERMMTPQDVEACIQSQRSYTSQQFFPPMQLHRIDFRFQNGTYREVGAKK